MDFNQLLILPRFLQIVITAVMLSSSTPILASTSFPIAKSGCEDSCGTVSIPFPFGTKEGCYLHEEFFINCTYSSNNTPRAVLQSSTVDVTDIFLEGQLRVLKEVGYDCYDRNGSSKPGYYFTPWMKLSSQYTFNSTSNKFTTVGCDTFGEVEGFTSDRTYTTGCVSFCDIKEDVIDGSCAGIGCCQTSIPPGAWKINVTLTSPHNHTDVWDFNNCSYAFVVEDGAFHFHGDNLTNLGQVLQLPVLVDWTIVNATCEDAQKNTSSYACFSNSECFDYEPEPNSSGYRCRCMEGYEGNPYLPQGCKDIDECLDPSLYPCAKHSVCNNTPGNYTCPCLKGYHGDGREGEDGCNPYQKHDRRIYLSITVVAIGTAILLACSFCLYSELKKRKANKLKERFFRHNGGLHLQQKLGQEADTNTVRIFTVEELQKATYDFDESRIIGRGGFGTVFKGLMADNRIVAIKKSKGVNQYQVEQFINEVIVLSQINNRHVVKLLGCCLETELPLLVYEFINNETLFNHLHDKRKASNLSWNLRLRLASEVAGVLSYLHSVASPPIIHRDIKSQNILLDHNYTAKLSDFGTSKLIPSDENDLSTLVKGTNGYLDPEYMQTGLLTDKSDVYSFGVVLAELLTRKKALSFDRREEERVLASHFLSSIKEDKLVQILDSVILSDESIEQVKEVAMIAKSCLNVKGEDRPSMKDVARELDVLEARAKQHPVHVFEVDSAESEAMTSMQSTAYVNSDDSSCLLYSGTRNMTEHMIADGR